jgi:hypothetical protein
LGELCGVTIPYTSSQWQTDLYGRLSPRSSFQDTLDRLLLRFSLIKAILSKNTPGTKAQQLPILSVEEYIQLERESSARYEYHDGKIYALAGGTLNHGLICGELPGMKGWMRK